MNNSETYLYSPKVSKDADYKVWMAYPGCEAFAMSSLGYLWLFKQLDEQEDIIAERVYSDSNKSDFDARNVDLIGFSFSFDTDFLEILKILEKFNIPFKSADRDSSYPLLYAGGPVVTANPEPYAEIIDFFILGDGEDVNLQAVRICKDNRDLTKAEILAKLAKIDGIYVPSVNQGIVKKATKRLQEVIYTPILSEKAFFPNTFIIEVARGCANRCGFCIASYLNLPFRFLPYEKIIEAIDSGLEHTNKIALLGAQLSAHPRFKEICNYVYQKIQAGQEIEMSVSSLRVDTITPEILETLKAAGQKNCTLAIEAGSERLRKVINKNLTEEQIFKAIDVAQNAGLKGFKFYGMLGLPTETQEDLEEMISLAKRIKQKYKGFDISFGFSTFVPKPHSPFQWFGREDNKTLEKKENFIKKEMHKIGVTATVSSAKWDYWQAVLSRGDRNLTDFLIKVYENGGKLGAFKSAAKELKIDTDYYALQNYQLEKDLPWNFIEISPKSEFLKQECQKLTGYSGV